MSKKAQKRLNKAMRDRLLNERLGAMRRVPISRFIVENKTNPWTDKLDIEIVDAAMSGNESAFQELQRRRHFPLFQKTLEQTFL